MKCILLYIFNKLCIGKKWNNLIIKSVNKPNLKMIFCNQKNANNLQKSYEKFTKKIKLNPNNGVAYSNRALICFFFFNKPIQG